MERQQAHGVRFSYVPTVQELLDDGVAELQIKRAL